MGDVVFLAHRNDSVDTTSMEVLSCKTCRNKTWLAVYEASGDGFPRLRCSCCGQDAGHFGWINDEQK